MAALQATLRPRQEWLYPPDLEPNSSLSVCLCLSLSEPAWQEGQDGGCLGTPMAVGVWGPALLGGHRVMLAPFLFGVELTEALADPWRIKMEGREISSFYGTRFEMFVDLFPNSKGKSSYRICEVAKYLQDRCSETWQCTSFLSPEPLNYKMSWNPSQCWKKNSMLFLNI